MIKFLFAGHGVPHWKEQLWHSLLLPQFQLSIFNNFGTRLLMRQRLELIVFSWMKLDSITVANSSEGMAFRGIPRGGICTSYFLIVSYEHGNLSSPTKKGRKDKPHVILFCRFTKLIICHLERIHNIHQRSTSLFHLAEEDLRLGNLKFVPKGKEDEVFGMPIPNELILNNIKNAPYYNTYLEMVTKHDQKVATKKKGKKKSASTKANPSQSHYREVQAKLCPCIEAIDELGVVSRHRVMQHVRVVESRILCIGEKKEEKMKKRRKIILRKNREEKERSRKGNYEKKDCERKRKEKRDLKEDTRRTPATEEASTGPSTQPQDDTSINIVHNSPSPADAETGAGSDKTNSRGDTKILQINEELGEDVEKQVDLEENTTELDLDRAGSDPGETHESRPQPEHVLMDEDQAGPDLFEVSSYGTCHPRGSLVQTGLFMSIKNLEVAMLLGTGFLLMNKSTVVEPGKLNVEVEVVSMVTVPIYQASSDTPESKLAKHVTALEKKLSNLEQNNKNLGNMTQNLGSRVYTLELRDLPHKINEAVHENVKEAIQIALQAPLRERFRYLSEEDMKDMLHQKMFESGTYKSIPEHIALYEELKASMPQDPQSSAWKKFDTQDAPSSSSKQQSSPYAEQPLKPILDDERPATPEPAWVIPTSHIPDAENNWANALASMYQAPAEKSLLEKTGDMRTFMNWYCQKANPEGDQVRIDISRPLPLSGPPGHVTIQTQFFFNKDLDYLRYVPLMVSLIGGLIVRNSTLTETLLTQVARADCQEYTIAEKDFKNLYPSDFEDMNMLILQGHINHLSGSDKRMLSTAVNLWTRNLVIRQQVKTSSSALRATKNN
ncbi:hypothetical protein Tco_0569322 [Tanacetum coccineum]